MKHTLLGLLLATVLCGTAVAQELQISGIVTTTAGAPLKGVTVQVRGTDNRTVTGDDGKYSLTAPGNGVLLYNIIGYRGTARTIAGRPSIDVALESVVAVLDPVIVTGYTTQRRADVTGAVASVDLSSANKQTSTSVLQRLDGRVSGVTVEDGGSPGSRTTVRIRGVTSFQNNDPLYVVDGTPVQDSYLNWLNPNEIGSVQVLKDASAASIYGSRASNGVVIIETKRGRAGQHNMTLDVRTGVATPVRGYDSFLIQNPLDYFQVVKTSYLNAGLAVPTNIYGNDTLGNNPRIPEYIWPNSCKVAGQASPCTSADVNLSTYNWPTVLIIPGSPGTNWWKAVFGSGQFRDANLAISGAGEDNSYLMSFNFLDQNGTAAFTRLQRGGLRMNTSFNVNKVTVGENFALARERSYGGLDDNALGEDNIIGKNIFQQPVVPVYDIAGNYASGKATGLSNLTNPLKEAWIGSQNISTNDRIFGNVFADYDAGRGLDLRTRFGFNLAQGAFRGYAPPFPENSEPTSNNGINENYSLFTEWTWSNTLNYRRTMGEHGLNVLLGQEAIRNTNRFEAGSCANLLGPDERNRFIQDALCDPTTKNVTSAGGAAALLSFFGKADYNFGDRYYLGLTLRRDGSSRLGQTHRWGTFPAVGAGWRIYRESFMPAKNFFSNAMLRFGWGVTGNQQIPPGRIVSQLGGDRGDTFYDIGGTNTSIQPWLKLTATGNTELKWEENRSVNVGVDLEVLDGRGTFSLDVYRRNSNNLLFDPRTPGAASTAAPPIINIGKMSNKGFDLSIGYRGTIGGGTPTLWSVTFNGSHYRNKIVQIDQLGTINFVGPYTLREQNPVINQIGYPLGSFYGLVADGYYRDSLDAAQCGDGDALGECWDDGARPGRIKFKDLNGDHHISAADATVIGSPHPNFTGGLDLNVRRGRVDISATLFGTFGNKIFNAQKYWYVFRYFDTNVTKDLLANSAVLDGPCAPAPSPRTDWICSGKLTNPNAKYPRLDYNDVSTFSRQFSSYWVEDGSYVRLRTLQIAYELPPALIRWIPAARVYVQVENLFTITGYSGLDPALPAWSAFGAAGDIRDQFRGVDEGSYPSNRTFTIGITTTF